MGLKAGYFESCKRKGKKLSLTWVQGRYSKKKVAGTQHYFKTANTAEGYLEALNQWAKIREDRLKVAQRYVSGYVADINSRTITNLHQALAANEKLGGERQKNVFKAFKSFVRWSWQEELLG
jgi:hypothetical protein